MKKFYALILALVGVCGSTVPADAADYRSVVFNKTDGTSLALTVESGMTTLVTPGFITLSCDKGVISLPTSELKGWTFSKELGVDFDVAGVDTPEADSRLDVALGAGELTLNGLAASSKVMLTAVNGQVVVSAVASDSYTIPTGNLTSGVYILTVNDKSLKIALK